MTPAADWTVVRTKIPSPDERAFVGRLARRWAGEHRGGSCLAVTLAVPAGAIALYHCATAQWPLGALFIGATLLFLRMGGIARVASRRVPFRDIVVARARCRMVSIRAGGHTGSAPHVGPVPVTLDPAWLAFWPENEIVEVEICPIGSSSGDVVHAIVVALPGITVDAAKRAGRAPSRNMGWPVLAVILLAGLGALLLALGLHSPSEVAAGVRCLSGPIEVAKVEELLANSDLIGVEVKLRQAARLSTGDETFLLDLDADELQALDSRLAQMAYAPLPPNVPQDLVLAQLDRERKEAFDASIRAEHGRILPMEGEHEEPPGVASFDNVEGILSQSGRWVLGARNHAFRDTVLQAVALFAFLFSGVMARRQWHRKGRELSAWVERVRHAFEHPIGHQQGH